MRIVDLSSQPDNFHRLDFDVPDATNDNSCLLSYFQYERALNDGGKTDLLNQVALQFFQEPTFDQLRTKEQLGYVVFSRPRSARDIISAWFLIQSPDKNCMHIRTRLDVHMAKMRTKVSEMTDETFATTVGAVMTNISEKDKNLPEEFGRYWNGEFSTHKYNFDRQEQEIALLSTITKAEVQAYIEKLFFQEKRANRLDIHWNSVKVPEEKKEEAKEEVKEAEPAADASAAAATTEPEVPEVVPTYETEMKHANLNQFKKSMGLFVDNYKLNYATTNFSL